SKATRRTRHLRPFPTRRSSDLARCAEGRPMSARTLPRHDPIVSARDIVNRFGKQEVHDKINLDVMPGEILGIAGGSGSGKSVLRSEEHTSELQSRVDLVCRLLL